MELSGKLEDGSATDLSQASVTYSSEYPSVLSVDHEGNVQALSAGISRITATVTLNGVTRTASIEVISAIHGLETSEVPILADAYVASGARIRIMAVQPH
ncbi:Ig-like domain-containing protein [Paenibacillus sp. GD4]|uniref:Ig-like domain-containing protein n=1 Tax=Paenibacillus sp. GD4 TaxID=3068890 RepID=UPI0027968FDC|nr:Ig-like domain-containing protein [Paenibacillus sp. GD4]MDQ1911570.1 Ig-like domain-containing protein [Paenibacillus sp. GD4]